MQQVLSLIGKQDIHILKCTREPLYDQITIIVGLYLDIVIHTFHLVKVLFVYIVLRLLICKNNQGTVTQMH